MAGDWIVPGNATVFVVPKVKKKFDESLKELLEKETGEEVDPVRLGEDLTEWVLARLSVKKWGKERGRRSPSTKALSRAFQALAAARYHLRGDAEAEAELRELRDRVEAIWLADTPPAT
ncbi:MAG: hypothetical protein ACQET1_12330 [Gemmatimonadota bacterium]